MKKLKVLKFYKTFTDLTTDYLSDRQQFVQIKNKNSPNRYGKFGLPQGSILGPTLFIIYVHNLKSCT